jgi:hypothetical protein
MLGFGKSGKTRRCQVVCYTRSQLPNDKCAKTISRLVEISKSKTHGLSCFVNHMSVEACDSVTEDEIDDQNIELLEQEPGCQERQVIRYGGKKIGLITFYLVETYEL